MKNYVESPVEAPETTFVGPWMTPGLSTRKFAAAVSPVEAVDQKGTALACVSAKNGASSTIHSTYYYPNENIDLLVSHLPNLDRLAIGAVTSRSESELSGLGCWHSHRRWSVETATGVTQGVMTL